MRIIGLDLAISSAHKAIVMDEKGQYLTPVFAVQSWAQELAGLLRRAREGVPERMTGFTAADERIDAL